MTLEEMKRLGLSFDVVLEDGSSSMMNPDELFLYAKRKKEAEQKKDKEQKTIMKARGASQSGLCSEERSMISPDYARNFICDFILGKEQSHSQPQLFGENI